MCKMELTYSHYKDDENRYNRINNDDKNNIIIDINDNLSDKGTTEIQLNQNNEITVERDKDQHDYKEFEDDGDEEDEDEDEDDGEDDHVDGIIDRRYHLAETPMTMSYTNSLIDIDIDVTPNMVTPTTTTATTPSQLIIQNTNHLSKNKMLRTKWKINEDIALLNVIINNSHLLTFLEYIKPMKIFWNKISKILLQLNNVNRNSRQCHDRFKVLYFKAEKFRAILDEDFDLRERSKNDNNHKKKNQNCRNKTDFTEIENLLLILLNMFKFHNGNIILNPPVITPTTQKTTNNINSNMTPLQINPTPIINQNVHELTKNKIVRSAPVTPIESITSHGNTSSTPNFFFEGKSQYFKENDNQTKLNSNDGLTLNDLGSISSSNNNSSNLSVQLSKVIHEQSNLKQEISGCASKVRHHDDKINQTDIKMIQHDEKFNVQVSNFNHLKCRIGTHNNLIINYGQQLDSHGQQLDSHGQQLDSHGQQLDSHGQQLDSHGQQLDSHGQQLKIHSQHIEQQTQKNQNHNQRLIEQRNELENQRLYNKGTYDNIFNLINDLKNDVNKLTSEVTSLTDELGILKKKNYDQERLIEQVYSLTTNSFTSSNAEHTTSTQMNT